MYCPNCRKNLEGGLIYRTFLKKYKDKDKALEIAAQYGATKKTGRWGEQIGIYDFVKDKIVKWQCPYCKHEWSR